MYAGSVRRMKHVDDFPQFSALSNTDPVSRHLHGFHLINT